MKILFWILALLSLPVGWFISFTSYLIHGLDLSGTVIGEVVCIFGILSLGICIVGIVLGIIKLRKGDVKKAVLFALAGWIYCAVVFGGYVLDEVVDTMRLEKLTEHYENETYGENWNTPSAIEGIPEEYQEVLNKFYVLVRDEATDGRLMDLGVMAMSNYYGDNSLENIGFVLMDLNGDKVDELVIGTTAPVEEGGTAIFCVYTNPENPLYTINSVESETHYLYPGATDGIYEVEIEGYNAAWVIKPAETENTFDFTYREGAMDPANRITLELIPFSQYK